MPFRPTREERRKLAADNRKFSAELEKVAEREWRACNPPPKLFEVWRSRDFLVQVFRETPSLVRLSVSRTEVTGDRWADGITWDELQRLKSECGRDKMPAVEIYPPDDEIVNVGNLRHLWVLPEAPEFMWRKT